MTPSEYPTTPAENQLPATDVAKDLSFVREILGRSVFPPEQQQTLEQNIRQVESRARDESLYLAVLGEFNSGKSTFINALLRWRLLKSAPQATTAAATMIRYGSSFSVAVVFNDGTKASGSESDFAELARKFQGLAAESRVCANLQEALHLATADPALTKIIDQVEVTLPADTLRDGTWVIDTPGIGAGAATAGHHQAVTERVTAEIADAAVVLIPADSAMTRTLLDFLGGSTRRFLHRCVFVITKMDHLEESDRESVCGFVESRLKQLMSRKPLILQSAAATILSNGAYTVASTETTYWRSSFVNMETTLHRELARNRAAIIAEHLTALLQILLTGLQDAVSTRRAALAQEHATLERNSVVALERVLSALFEKCRSEIEQEVQNCKLRVSDYAEVFDNHAEQAAVQLLDRATKDTLMSVVESGVPAAIAQHQHTFDVACQTQFANLERRCERVQQLFTQQFEESYGDLRALGLRIEVASFGRFSDSIGKGHFSAAGAFLNAARKAREEIGAKIGTVGGCIGAPLAALLGAFIGLLAGCAVSDSSFGGGFVGMFLGGMGGFVASIMGGRAVGANVGRVSNFSEQRAEVRTLLIPEVRQHVAAAKTAWVLQFDKAGVTAIQLLGHGVAAHTQEYAGAVNRMLEEHARKTAGLAEQARQADKDSAELLTRRKRLDEARDILLRIGA